MDFQSLPKTQAKLIKEIKETMFSLLDIGSHDHLLLLPCAYETAWLAMIPDTDEPSKPMFEGCLSWVLNNQTEHGFWGNCDESGMPTLGCLTATLACVVALSKWNVGSVMISKVPTTYPNDKDLIKLCIINLIERLGLAEYFTVEIEEVLQQELYET
ncbi:hypothetical protein G4B88_002828 [Cannabis sativa]|uniref:Uncharacterized protein n=1 Tax=Cannabis sativa TaxID=3483 RepID=A0A7J6ECW8_CANSA|nr:hypothetical protein G4B88_002828 [Cannabis sativa]